MNANNDSLPQITNVNPDNVLNQSINFNRNELPQTETAPDTAGQEVLVPNNMEQVAVLPTNVQPVEPVPKPNNCVCCPYGSTVVIPATFAGLALLFSFISCYGCGLFDLGTRDASIGYYSVEAKFLGDEVAIGNGNQCVIVPSENTLSMDITWKLGRSVAAFITITNMINFIYICVVACCVRFTVKCVSLLGIFIGIVGMGHLLLFIGLQSQICYRYECKVGWGMYLGLLAMLSWIIVGYSLKFINLRITPDIVNYPLHGPFAEAALIPFVADAPGNENTTTIEMTETPQANGTLTRTTTIIINNPDGSRTTRVTTETNIIPGLASSPAAPAPVAVLPTVAVLPEQVKEDDVAVARMPSTTGGRQPLQREESASRVPPKMAKVLNDAEFPDI